MDMVDFELLLSFWSTFTTISAFIFLRYLKRANHFERDVISA